MVNIIFFNIPMRPGKFVSTEFGKTGFGKTVGSSQQGRVLIDVGASYIDRKAQQISYAVADRFTKALRNKTKGHKVKPGVTVGVIDNSDHSFVCPSNFELSYKHNVSSTVLSSESQTKIFKDYFNAGQPTTKTFWSFAKNKLIDKKSLVDSERDYLSSGKRQLLTCNYGFNQKSYNFLLNDTFLSVADYKFLFKNFKTQLYDSKGLGHKNLYGNIFYEHLKLRIKSETDFYTTRLRLHLVKITNPSISVTELIGNSFADKNREIVSPYVVPIERQISINPVSYDKFRCEVITDLKCSLRASTFFNDNAKIVKTFKRNLGPNDIWDFNYYLHYGPGLQLNRLFETGEEKNYRFPYVNTDHPAGYFFVIEGKGDPRCSITRTADGANFDGSSPGRFDITFLKELKFVRDPENLKEVMTIREFSNNDEDFADIGLADYFSPDRENKINVDATKLNVNRVPDETLPYQVRYGEGRISVYFDPKLAEALKSASQAPSVTSESTLEPTSIMDPDYTEQPGAQQPSLRGESTDGDPDQDQDIMNL